MKKVFHLTSFAFGALAMLGVSMVIQSPSKAQAQAPSHVFEYRK